MSAAKVISVGLAMGLIAAGLLVWELQRRRVILPPVDLSRSLRAMSAVSASEGSRAAVGAPAVGVLAGMRTAVPASALRGATDPVIMQALLDETGLPERIEEVLVAQGIDAEQRQRFGQDFVQALSELRKLWQDELGRGARGNAIVIAQCDLFFALLPELAQRNQEGLVQLAFEREAQDLARASFELNPFADSLRVHIAGRDLHMTVSIAKGAVPFELWAAVRASFAPLLASFDASRVQTAPESKGGQR